MPERNERVTHKKIAALLGVHRATVSLALKNHPSIGLETRRRIKALADELGYRPDPMLSSLAAYRQQNCAPAFKGVIAWLSRSTPDYEWSRIPLYCTFFTSACATADRYGYKVEEFKLEDSVLARKRLASILCARNISGLLLAPQPHANAEVDFPWGNFSAVTFGYTLAKPQMHTVSSTQFRAMVTALHEIKSRGYRRIGFAFSPAHDARVDHNYLAGYLLDNHFDGSEILITQDTDYDKPRGKFARWLRERRVEVILTGNYRIAEALMRAGLRVPEDVGVVCPSLPNGDLGVAGIHENAEAIGRVAVEFLIAALQRGESGIPVFAQRILLEGKWVEGTTIRPRV